jgi:hypothetical protein
MHARCRQPVRGSTRVCQQVGVMRDPGCRAAEEMQGAQELEVISVEACGLGVLQDVIQHTVVSTPVTPHATAENVTTTNNRTHTHIKYLQLFMAALPGRHRPRYIPRVTTTSTRIIPANNRQF